MAVACEPRADPATEAQRAKAHRELDLLLDQRLGNGYSGDVTLTLFLKCGGVQGIKIKTEEVRR